MLYINDGTNKRSMSDSIIQGLPSYHSDQVEANKNCALCTLAPFLNKSYSQIKQYFNLSVDNEDNDQNIARNFILSGEEHSLQGQLNSMKHVLETESKIKVIDNIELNINKNNYENAIQDALSNRDNVGIICSIEVSEIGGICHWIYGQKSEGEIQFIDFQQNKKTDRYPEVTDQPTGYDFDKRQYIYLKDMVKNNTPISIKLAITNAIAPNSIQDMIKKFKDSPHNNENVSRIDEEEWSIFSDSLYVDKSNLKTNQAKLTYGDLATVIDATINTHVFYTPKKNKILKEMSAYFSDENISDNQISNNHLANFYKLIAQERNNRDYKHITTTEKSLIRYLNDTDNKEIKEKFLNSMGLDNSNLITSDNITEYLKLENRNSFHRINKEDSYSIYQEQNTKNITKDSVITALSTIKL